MVAALGATGSRCILLPLYLTSEDAGLLTYQVIAVKNDRNCGNRCG